MARCANRVRVAAARRPVVVNAAISTGSQRDVRAGASSGIAVVYEVSEQAAADAPSDAAEQAPAAGGAEARYPGLPPGMTTADVDATRFKLHPSVDYWRTYRVPSFTFLGSDSAMSTSSLIKSLNDMVGDVASMASVRDSQSAAYWAYHTARMGFFIVQAVGSLVSHQVSETFGSAKGGGYSDDTPLRRLSSAATSELYGRVSEAMATFSQDYENITSGVYPLPWDMTTLSHRQYNPFFAAAKSAQFLQEAAMTLQRRVRNTPEPVWLQSKMYPQYFTKSYHYQTDGWLSRRSADIYEFSTETLFFGRQDAMQRLSLLPLAEHMRAAAQEGRDVRSMKLLEVAAGTGRFHTFLKDAYPDLPTTVSDLSPFYLARARDNLKYWKQMRQPGSYLGGSEDMGVEFLQAPVEDIGAPDASFDVVVCVYLFHELPDTIRRRAAAEFLRVLKPGGMMILTDSVQLGDRPAWDATIGNFSNFNEPYYKSFVACDMGKLFQEAGFECDTKYLCSATKSLSFIKPRTPTTTSGADAVSGTTAAAVPSDN